MSKDKTKIKRSRVLNFIEEFVGWYGVFAIVFSYAMLSFGYFTIESLPYLILNGSGSLGIIIVSFKRRTFQPAILNVIWVIITLMSLIKILSA